MDDVGYMLRAIDLARYAYDNDEVPVGALVVKNNLIIAEAWNEKERKGDATAHAEMLALSRAARNLGSWRLSGCTLYVTMEPCPMCAGACVLSRIERVVYGAPDPKMGCAGSVYDLLREKRFNHFVEVVPGVLEDECSALLSRFFAVKREKK